MDMPFDTHNLRPKRIALFSGNYNYVMDGPVRALNTLVGFLEEQGIEVLVFAPTAKEAAFQHKGTLVSVPSVALPGSRSEYRLALGLPRRIKRQLEAFQPDLVHLAAPDILGWSALRWARKHKVPAVASFHTRFDTYGRYYHMAWLEKYVTALMRRFYHRCEQVYVPSECMREILAEQDMAKDLRIWSRGVDAAQFNPGRRDMAWRRENGFADKDVVIAFVGRLVLEKGLGVFADTLDELRRRGVPFKALIVGDGPERERFSTRLPDAVFTGYLQGDALARAYASSDIFFNASITETFGNVTLEAMASAVPAVCADATGSHSLVSAGETGFLVEPGNIDAFADKLATLISDDTLRATMSQASLAHSADRTWNAVLNRLLENYSEAVANCPERAWQGMTRRDFSAAE
jgi:phosphatidylinositol alpha 1,6-mannosyltransferase